MKKRKKPDAIKQNSYGGGLANMLLFSGTPSIETIINARDYGQDTAYSLSYSLTNKNVVVSRFVQFIADAMTGIALVDKNGDEMLSGEGSLILEEVKSIFGDEGELTEWIYNTVRNYVACGMSLNAPSIVSEQGHAIKIIPLDNRKVILKQNKEGVFELEYRGDKIPYYSKTLKKPSLNREGYGDCLFSGAIDDALVDRYTKLTAQKKYENNANPDVIYMIEPGKVISEEQKNKIERSFKERFGGAENQGKPLVSDLIREVKVIDSMDAVVKSIDIRLHSNKNIGMMLGVDLRGLGWLREGGSEAELHAVRNAVNAEFSKRADLLGKTLTRAYEKLIAPLNGANIKIIPNVLKDNQVLIKIALDAYDKGILEKEYVQNLLYNEIG